MNQNAARSLLQKNAQTGKTLTYREFAAALRLTEPPIIRATAKILEELMCQDHMANRPLLAALVIQQGRNKIPRLGFYQILSELKLYNGEAEGSAAIQWHQTEITKLKEYYPSSNPNDT